MSAVFFFYFVTIGATSIQWFAIVYEKTGGGIKDAHNKERMDEIVLYRDEISTFFLIIIVVLGINPMKNFYRKFRFGIIKAAFQLLIAPFGDVSFRVYLLGEILTDFII